MKRFEQFLNEIKLGKWQYDIKKHQFKKGDICIFVKDHYYEKVGYAKGYISPTNILVGERCIVKDVGYVSGVSLFPNIISNFFYYSNSNFGRERIKSYNVQFLNVYDSKQDYTKDVNKAFIHPSQFSDYKGRKQVFISCMEDQLELDKEYMEKERIKIKELNNKMKKMDPYDEENWTDDENITEFIKYNESIDNDLIGKIAVLKTKRYSAIKFDLIHKNLYDVINSEQPIGYQFEIKEIRKLPKGASLMAQDSTFVGPGGKELYYRLDCCDIIEEIRQPRIRWYHKGKLKED